MSYNIFSSVYDILTENVNYTEIADKISSLLCRNGIDGGLLLDLGCGTGNLSFLLENKGYDIIGVDLSEDMLSVANEKKYEYGSDALFLCQSGESLDLYGTVDCAVSSLDTVNHIESIEKIKKTFEKVSLFMNPNGIFIFDFNTEYKHRQILGSNTFVYDVDDVYCIWQNTFNEKSQTTKIDLDFFIQNENNSDYKKYSESFFEYSYSEDAIYSALKDAGFEIISLFDNYSEKPVNETTERITVVAKKI